VNAAFVRAAAVAAFASALLAGYERPSAALPTVEPVVYREVGPRPRIVLSKITRIRGTVGPGPFLGRPPYPRDGTSAFTVPKITEATQLEDAIVAAINSDRRTRGLRVLRASRPLAAAADAHARSLALAGAFTHDWPLTPRSPFARWITRYYRRPGRRPWSAGENLLWAENSLDAEQALRLWLNSPSHRRILVGAQWRELAVGVMHAESAGGVFGGRTVVIAAAEFGAR
jgi:uncharacterized protein YkwD